VSAEVASGKGAGDENFPVGSRLIARAHRPHVMRYYAFARAIDDIADSPHLPAEAKIDRLDAFGRALRDPSVTDPAYDKAIRLRESLAETGVPVDHGLDLITAFKQDATQTRYTDWSELMTYCRYSAEPVGRFLLDLHGEDRALWPFSDALCTALQVLNHLQDCADDHARLDRVYLPTTWLEAEGVGVGALSATSCAPGLRRVLDRCLQGVAELLAPAARLPERLRSPRLAMESAAIVALARAITEALHARDPLAERVELSKPRKAAVGAGGALHMALRRWRGPIAAPAGGPSEVLP
jgi:squalene synthase HpnC